jgi:hypothetical protein
VHFCTASVQYKGSKIHSTARKLWSVDSNDAYTGFGVYSAESGVYQCAINAQGGGGMVSCVLHAGHKESGVPGGFAPAKRAVKELSHNDRLWCWNEDAHWSHRCVCGAI